jgi:hypothetical protein
MTTGTTSLLSLALPVQGELDGTWGDVVNYGITDYIDIAVAGTLTLNGDGAVTLLNTVGTVSGTNINGTTAQYAIIKVTGTLTTTKVITAPSYSKTYIVDNAATGGAVSFQRSGQITPVSVAVGEKCTVYYNGTDYVKVASSVADGVTSVTGTGTVNGITLTGTVTSTGNLTLGGTLSGVSLTSQVTGTLPIANGGTGTTSTQFANLTTNVTGTLPVANGGTGTTTPALVQGSGVTITGTWPNQTISATGSGGTITSVTASPPLASSGGTSPNISITSSTGSGAVVLATSPTLVTPALGTPTSGNFGSGTFTWPTFNQNTTGTAAGLSSTLVAGSGGTGLTSPGTAGNVLTSTGSGWVSSAPSGGTVAGGTIYLNTTVISQNYTFPSGSNGMSVGPMTVSSGYAVTVTSGQRWVIL